jgi:hypothetical protein
MNGTDAEKKWSFQFFKESMGHLLVDVFDNRKNNNGAFTKPDLKMKFSEFLEHIEKDSATPYRMFLFNLFKHNPELTKDFPCPAIFKGLLDGIGYTFFAGKDTSVRLHYDIDMSGVLHTQVIGYKKVILIHQDYNDLLYKLPLNTFSMVDILHPDYNRFPALHKVVASECILEPGDTIFMPSGYWHLMNYLTAGMAVAYRKMPQDWSTRWQGFQNLMINMPLDKLLNQTVGKRWSNFKAETAQRNADRAIVQKYRAELVG